jgi:TolB protein
MVEALNIAVRKAAPPEPAQPVAVEAAPGPQTISFVTRVEQVWEKPRGKFALVGGAVVVLVVLGLLLSQLPGRVQIAAPGATTTAIIERTATQAGGAAQVATPTPSRPAVTATPFPVPLPAVEGKLLIQCENVRPIQICSEDIGERLITPVTHDLNFGVVGASSWSPDGRQIAFSAAQTDTAPVKLYIINADGTDLKPITIGTNPAWSADGQWIAFEREDGLWLIRPDGSDARRVLPNKPNQFYAAIPAWSPDSQRLALLNFNKAGTEIWVVNADGSELRMIYASDQAFDGGYVSWSPDGQWIHWKRGKGGVSSDVIVPADGKGEPQALASFPAPDWWHTGFWPQWGGQAAAAPCRIAYEQDGDIYVKDCDGTGARQVTFLQGVRGLPSWSPDGEYIVFSSGHEGVLHDDGNIRQFAYVIRADGSDLKRLSGQDNFDQFPAWSPDGRRIALHRNCSLVTISPDGSDEQMIVRGSDEICPNTMAWSPDSQAIAFNSWHGPFPDDLNFVIYVVNSDGSNLRKLGKFEEGNVPTWSPDGKQIGVEDMGNAYLLNTDGSGEPVKVSSIADAWHAWHWPQWGGEVQAAAAQCRIVFVGYEGNYNVHVRNCDGSGVQQVTDLVTEVSAPEHPVWSPDGQAILFVSRHEGNKSLNSTGEPCTSLYVVRPDGTGLARWTRDRCDDQPSWSPDGTRIAFHRECDLAIMNLDGTGISVIARPHEELFCIDQSAWSPDGQRIAFTSLKWPSLGVLAEQAVFVASPDGSNLTQLASIPAENWVEYSVVWSPAGDQIAFRFVQDGLEQNYSVNSDGSGEPTRIIEIPESWYPWYWPQWGGEAQPTLSAQADQARAFAEPILKAIADRRPDYQDDFSNPKSGWTIASYAEGERAGESGYKDGEYFLVANPASVQYPAVHSWLEVPAPEVSDFVVEFEARIVSAGDGSIYAHFRVQEKNVYAATVATDGQLRLGTETISSSKDLAVTRTDPIKAGQTNRIRIIAQGPQIALYLNGQPMLMTRQEFIDRGGIILGIWNGSRTPMQVNFDNFKVWHIADTTTPADQARAFAEPILQAIAERKPDYQDDFSNAPDSVLSLKGGPDDVTYTRPEMQAADFVMQFEFIPKTTDNSNVVFQMRWSPTDMTFLDFSFWPQTGEWRVSSHVNFVVSTIVRDRASRVEQDLRAQVTVIARGEQFAIYLNEDLLTYFRDSSSTGTGNAIKSQGGLSTTEIDFDNIKFWNLANVSGLP